MTKKKNGGTKAENVVKGKSKGKGKGDLGICVDRPTIGPDGEFKMEAPRDKKGKREKHMGSHTISISQRHSAH